MEHDYRFILDVHLCSAHTRAYFVKVEQCEDLLYRVASTHTFSLLQKILGKVLIVVQIERWPRDVQMTVSENKYLAPISVSRYVMQHCSLLAAVFLR